LCKKTFSSGKPVVPVIDLSEAVNMSMIPDKATDSAPKSKREMQVVGF
jgi:hypothetical protein